MRFIKYYSFIFLTFLFLTQTGCLCTIPGGKKVLPVNSGGEVKSQPNAVSGLYTGETWKYAFVPNIGAPGGGSWQYQVTRRRYYFLSNNRVFWGAPVGGLDRFDYDKACRKEHENCGRYQVSGQKINIVWGDDSKEELNINNYSTLQEGDITVNRIDKYENLRLDGEWGLTNYVSVTAPGDKTPSQTAVSSEKTIELRADGKFKVKGFTGFVTGGDEIDAASSDTVNGAGTYEINDNTLTLKFSDGRMGRYTFCIHPNDNKVIVIDGITYIMR